MTTTTQVPTIQAWIVEEYPTSPNPKTPAKYRTFTKDHQYLDVYGAQGLPVGTCIQVVASTNAMDVKFFRIFNVLHVGSGVIHPTVFEQMSDDADAIRQAYDNYEESLDALSEDTVTEEEEEPMYHQGGTDQPLVDAPEPEAEEPVTQEEPAEVKPKRKRRSKAEIEADNEANSQAYVEAGEPCTNPIIEAVINLRATPAEEICQVEEVPSLYSRLDAYIHVHNELVKAGIEPLPDTIRLILEF